MTAHRAAVAAKQGRWPEWALVLKALATAGERGVGDTAERLFGLFDTPQFKTWHQNVFGCACASRCPNEWNARYPYIDLPR